MIEQRDFICYSFAILVREKIYMFIKQVSTFQFGNYRFHIETNFSYCALYVEYVIKRFNLYIKQKVIYFFIKRSPFINYFYMWSPFFQKPVLEKLQLFFISNLDINNSKLQVTAYFYIMYRDFYIGLSAIYSLPTVDIKRCI